jgi:hypothetical protein
MPNQAHTKRQITTRAQPSRIAPARSHHSNNDHMKGNEHAIEAQKHSKVASAACDEAHAKSLSKK